MKNPVKIMTIYMIVLLLFSTYVLMDTFVISRVYGDEEDTYASDNAAELSQGEDDTLASNDAERGSEEQASIDLGDAFENSDTSYSDGNISVNLNTYREYDTTIYVADVKIKSADYLKTALAQGQYGKNVKEETSVMAERAGAVLAINGDYYGVRERGYVIKNGNLYRNSAIDGQEDLVIYADGSYEIIDEGDISAEELMAKGAVQTLSFGPVLVEDDSILVGENEEVGKAMASNPRTAIGIIDDNHYVFVVSDGRTSDSAGLSLYELAEIMRDLGVKTAYNLDGGGSSTMYFNGNVINTPTGGRAGHGSGSERSVSDIVYIGY